MPSCHAANPPCEQLSAHPDFRPLASIANLAIDLRYAQPNNFMGRDMYSPLDCAWAHRDAATGLSCGQPMRGFCNLSGQQYCTRINPRHPLQQRVHNGFAHRAFGIIMIEYRNHDARIAIHIRHKACH